MALYSNKAQYELRAISCLSDQQFQKRSRQDYSAGMGVNADLKTARGIAVFSMKIPDEVAIRSAVTTESPRQRRHGSRHRAAMGTTSPVSAMQSKDGFVLFGVIPLVLAVAHRRARLSRQFGTCSVCAFALIGIPRSYLSEIHN